MNGRLQRIWVLLRLAVAAGVGWRFGWAWGLLTLALHAAILAGGFVQLRWVNRPAPSWGQLLRAWAKEVVASELAFSWRQPWREWAEPDHLPAAGAERGVLLVHGFSCNRGRWNGWMKQLREQGVAFIAPSLEPAFGSIDAYADEIEAGVRTLKVLTGRMPILCAHSMGGLALRAWWRQYGADHEAPHVVTLGSPHQGTRMAALGLGINTQQMRLGNAWLAALPGLPDVDCFWTPCDQIVNPAERAILAGARAHRLDGVGHMGLVHSDEAWQLVQTALAGSSFSTPRRI